jgi:hypothetical protein
MPRGGALVIKNLNKAITGIKGRTSGGIRLAASMIMGESKKLCPVDTGNLKGSHYVRMETSASGYPVARIGCTAEYAIYVHENLEISHPQHKSHNCGGGAKFLERAYKNKAKDAIAIIIKTAKVK